MTEETPENAVLFEVVDNHVAVITLNRPRVRNAVNGAVAQGLEAAVLKVENTPELRAAILTSSQDEVFCAGADLSEISKGRSHLLATEKGGFAGFVNHERDKPWIAVVEGAALAGGLEISLACDMIVASEKSRFGLPEVKRGLYAGAGGVYRLPRRIPRNVALELLATGDPIDAQRAYNFGLINRMVAPGQAYEAAIELAKQIAANAPLSVKETMRVARLSQDFSEAEMKKISDEASARVFASKDAKEGPLAFVEKRQPVWTGE